VSLEALMENLERVMPDPRVIPLSALTGEGMNLWLDWLEERYRAREVLAPAAHRHHGHESVHA